MVLTAPEKRYIIDIQDIASVIAAPQSAKHGKD
jgi:hypothetical protein